MKITITGKNQSEVLKKLTNLKLPTQGYDFKKTKDGWKTVYK